MKFILPLEIECGETGCASEPGKFCEYAWSQRFGTIHFCYLFSEKDEYKGRYTPLAEKDGWLLRHPRCLAMAKEASSGEKAKDS